MATPGRVVPSTLRQCVRIASSQGSKHWALHARRPPQCSRPIATHTLAHQASALSVLPTAVDSSTTEYRENAREMDQVMARLNDLHAKIAQGGPPKARDKHVGRGKMLVRDRVTALIDPGTSFLELSSIAGYALYPGEDIPAGGIITGVGVVEGVSCVIIANDSTVKGGTYYPITVKKHLRAQAIAQENSMLGSCWTEELYLYQL
ncbi:MAG: hypothetical protein M1830_008650 [Pleopsidium flavum]|nr:MAG: hypothetical protein M1830_008650 [Pleopsidium flavum]